MVGLNKRLRQIDEMAARIKQASNELGENLADATISITEKSADLKEDLADIKEELAERGAGLKENLADIREELTERSADLKEDIAGRVAAQKAEQEARRTAREAALRRREAALAELKAANEELLSTYGFGQRRLLRAFPQMTSTRYAAAMEQVKSRVRDMRKKPSGSQKD